MDLQMVFLMRSYRTIISSFTVQQQQLKLQKYCNAQHSEILLLMNFLHLAHRRRKFCVPCDKVVALSHSVIEVTHFTGDGNR